MKLFEELKYRGLIESISSPELEKKINDGGLTFYIGTDPTADSLHIGHFSSLLVAKRLKDHGHHPIMLVGGATGLIGDPKPNSERPMITKEELNSNYMALSEQIKSLFGFEMVNNYDWSKDINFIDYLRDYGKFFPLTYMLNKDTVKRRIDVGITYTEFSYMILQALDFLYLYEHKNCTLQIGGQDQWGNITAGIELIRRKINGEAFALTMPLITKADGTKFGKSETGTMWLSKEKTTPYEMYQFLLNTEDNKVIEYLKKLTILTVDTIKELEQAVINEPHKREAQKALAASVISYLHGELELNKVLKITNALFNNDMVHLKADEILIALKDMPNFSFKLETSILDIIVENNIASSKREAREFIEAGALFINDAKVTDENLLISNDILLDNKLLVIRRGKKKYYVGMKSII